MANKFDMMFDMSEMVAEFNESETKDSGDFKEVPYGDYEVKVERAELKESRAGKPMVSVWYKVLTGDFSNSIIFYNQVVERGFQLSIVYKLLRQLTGEQSLKLTTYSQLEDDLDKILNCELHLAYEEGKNGFAKYTVKEVF